MQLTKAELNLRSNEINQDSILNKVLCSIRVFFWNYILDSDQEPLS